MIKKLKYKFIIYSLISFLAAMFALVVFLNLFISIKFTTEIDQNLEFYLQGELDHLNDTHDDFRDEIFRGFADRVFIVYLNGDGDALSAKIAFPDLISLSSAYSYAENIITLDQEKGWSDNYRYLVYETQDGYITVFIDGDFFGYAITEFRNISLLALLVTTILVTVFIYFASKQAIKPIVESQERQKQFMTDASHELKTPLTVISANTEILKMNDPNNEWLDSILRQTHTLTHLIKQIIKMSKLDEQERKVFLEDVNISQIACDLIDDFKVLAKQKNINLEIEIQKDIFAKVHRESIKELFGILLDNAIKYTNEGMDIKIKLAKEKKVNFYISNYTDQVSQIDFKNIFQRFYRADHARKSDGSFGLGLSIAKSIVDLHQGHIKALMIDDNHIGFELNI